MYTARGLISPPETLAIGNNRCHRHPAVKITTLQIKCTSRVHCHAAGDKQHNAAQTTLAKTSAMSVSRKRAHYLIAKRAGLR